MRTTVDIPDELFRRAKVEAALHGRTLKDLVEEGLRLVIEKKLPETPPEAKKSTEGLKPRPGSLHEAMQNLCGIFDDGPPDLSTNKQYFDDFGR